jgi:hypothetical protein
MPLRYRRYYLQKLSETHEKQQEAIDKKFGGGELTSPEPSKLNKLPPLPIPDFATKVRAPKK